MFLGVRLVRLRPFSAPASRGSSIFTRQWFAWAFFVPRERGGPIDGASNKKRAEPFPPILDPGSASRRFMEMRRDLPGNGSGGGPGFIGSSFVLRRTKIPTAWPSVFRRGSVCYPESLCLLPPRRPRPRRPPSSRSSRSLASEDCVRSSSCGLRFSRSDGAPLRRFLSRRRPTSPLGSENQGANAAGRCACRASRGRGAKAARTPRPGAASRSP